MKTKQFLTLIVFLFGITLFNSCGNSDTAKSKTDSTTQAKVYACPMHPEVTSDKPGSCSKCGMDLEEVKK